MIARVASFTFPTVQHREAAERNGSERVGPSLAAQPGFRAIYYGRTAELEALSISLFDSPETAIAAGDTMNAQPLLSGHSPEMLPTPEALTFYDVADEIVHDRVPGAGRLGYMTLAPGVDAAAEEAWRRTFTAMLRGVPGLAQAFLLASPEGDERISLTFWADPKAMEDGGRAIGSWQAARAAEGRTPAMVGQRAVVLSDLRTAIAGVPATMPVAASTR